MEMIFSVLSINTVFGGFWGEMYMISAGICWLIEVIVDDLNAELWGGHKALDFHRPWGYYSLLHFTQGHTHIR